MLYTIMNSITVICSLYIIKKINKPKLRRFYLPFIFMSLFVLFNFQNTQISSRLILFTYFFIPFIIPLFISTILNINNKLASNIYNITSLFIITYFIISYNTSNYTYEASHRAFLDLNLFILL